MLIGKNEGLTSRLMGVYVAEFAAPNCNSERMNGSTSTNVPENVRDVDNANRQNAAVIEEEVIMTEDEDEDEDEEEEEKKK